MNSLKRFMAVITFTAVAFQAALSYADENYLYNIKDVMESIYKFDVGAFNENTSSDTEKGKYPESVDFI